jgi:hypothetical protein
VAAASGAEHIKPKTRIPDDLRMTRNLDFNLPLRDFWLSRWLPF